jgi:hypothetical protein
MAMGLPRDKCHAVSTSVAGACTTPVGDGNWDRNAYFRVNYGCTSQAAWQNALGYGAEPSRYQVYIWEIANRGSTLCSRTVGAPRIVSGTGPNAVTSYDQPVCGAALPANPPSPDRRRIAAAVVNCEAHDVGGNSENVPVLGWVDFFLVEPSVTRNRSGHQRSTGQQDVYVELIEETSSASNASLQVVKKAVPYLIE